MKTYHCSRLLLGLIFLIFGLNGFFNFIPVPAQPEPASRFISQLITTGYMLYFWKSIEIISAICFLLNHYTFVAGLIALPVSTNIFAFHLFLDKEPILISILVLVLNIIILSKFKKILRSMTLENDKA